MHVRNLTMIFVQSLSIVNVKLNVEECKVICFAPAAIPHFLKSQLSLIVVSQYIQICLEVKTLVWFSMRNSVLRHMFYQLEEEYVILHLSYYIARAV